MLLMSSQINFRVNSAVFPDVFLNSVGTFWGLWTEMTESSDVGLVCGNKDSVLDAA